MRKIVTLLAIVSQLCLHAIAQVHAVTGNVTDDKGAPIEGASIQVRGSRIGTAADSKGNFKINVKDGDVLIISATGFTNKEVKVNSAAIAVSLTVGANIIDEVVVTALGIKRKADNLTYASQGIKSDRLTTTRITDVNVALAGKIAGVQVRTQSAAKLGAVSSIRLRGAGSLNDKNPLFIVDGTPIDDVSLVNMDDVDDVQVLKGPAATALYGQRADAGAILLTTKKGIKKKGIGIEINSSIVANKVGRLPRYQNEYAGGTAGSGWQTFTWAPGMPDEWKALDGKKYHLYNDDASWGPKIDGSEYIPWYAWIPGSKYSFKTASLTAQPDNIKNFYSTGLQYVNNVSLSKAGDGYYFRVSYTNQDETGLIPYSWLKRNSFSSQLSVDLDKHFTVGTNINFVSQQVRGDFQDTYGNPSSGSFNQWFHRDLDMNILKELKDLKTPYGRLTGWNLNDGNGINRDDIYNGTAYWANPFSYFDRAYGLNKTDRLFGDFNLTYKLNNHFKIAGFFRRNQRNTTYESFVPSIFQQSTVDMSSALSIGPKATAGISDTRPVYGTYRTFAITAAENNYEFLASYNNKFGKIAVDVNAGGNIRQNNYSSIDNGTKGGLVVPDLFSLANSVLQPFYYSRYRENKTVRSLYGRASANWDDIFVLDFTLRNDWSSALPANENSYLYPSVGASMLLTKYVQRAVPFINFLKVRGNWAQVGSDLNPYQLSLLYTPGTTQWVDPVNASSNPVMTTPDRLVNPQIKPALSTSYEGGLDVRILNDRIGLSATFYKEKRNNEIVTVPITGSSGFTQQLINAGRVDRSGIELMLEATPVAGKKVRWNTTVNFAKNVSKIVTLAPNLTTLYLAGSDYSSDAGTPSYAPGIWHIEGQEWGQIRGRGIKRIDGKPVILPNGTYDFVDNVNFGSVLPDFTGGFLNQLSYKNFILSIAIDFAKGGKYFSLSDFWGQYSGLYDYTAGLNEKGKPVRDPVSAGGGVHVTGVDNSKNPVDMYVDAITYYQTNGGRFINEMHIFDLSYVKLREITLTYRFGKLGKLSDYIQTLQLSGFVRNPWLIYAANRNFDPSELTGNYGESGQLPPSRSFGLSLKIGF